MLITGFTVWAFSEALGEQLLTYRPVADDGYRAWMKGGYATVGCVGNDFSEFYMTPCMVKAMFTAAEKSLKDVGVDVSFQYQLNYTDFAGYDAACDKTPNCVTDTNWKWKAASRDILLLPKWNSSQGYTRTFQDGTSVTTITAGKGQVFQTAALFRHELAHVMGFAAHLYDPDPWVYTGCGVTFTVKPYAQSGLPKSCDNDTFLGTWIDPGKSCANLSMNDPHLYESKWNVPLYGTMFKNVFSCWVSQQNGKSPVPTPPPPPSPPPVPVPPPPPPAEPAICKDLRNQLQANGCE